MTAKIAALSLLALVLLLSSAAMAESSSLGRGFGDHLK